MRPHEEMLVFMREELDGREFLSLGEMIRKAGGVERVYLVVVDVLKGFCETGPLASPRVNGMVEPVAALAEVLVQKGLPPENIVFLNDAHSADAPEFSAFPSHCLRGSREAEVVDRLKPLAETPGVQVFSKNAISGLFGVNERGERFHAWLEQEFQKGPSTFLVVGDCTDLCIYQNAMGIRLLANELNASARVIVPVTHVRTYDLPAAEAKRLGALAHDGDFMELVFLYHLLLNGVEVVRGLGE
jgi:nicotinamidase-related amidase